MAKKVSKIIPITKPLLGKEEFRAVREVISSGWVAQGPKVKEFEDAFSLFVGSKYACAVSSCTTALHMALLAVGVKPGDMVITVSHSFIATANAVRYCAAEPIFVDIDLDAFNMSVEALKKCLLEDCQRRNGKLYYRNIAKLARGESPLSYVKITGRAAAILVVHQMGMPCDLGQILLLAKKFNLPVVEDAACAIGSEIKFGSKWEKIGKPHGDIACFSFHPRKVITTGEGGMLTTNNHRYDRYFRLLRQHGMSISDVVRHKAKKVSFEKYIITGYNYRMTDIQAAIGIEQMKRLPKIIKERRKIAKIYQQKLGDIPWLIPPLEPAYCKANWQSYPVRVRDNAPLSRDEIMQYLLDAGIATRRGIMNVHQEKPYSLQGWRLKKSELARDSVILLPLFPDKALDVERIAKYLRNANRYL